MSSVGSSGFGGGSTGRQEALRDSLNTLLVLVFFWDLWTLRKIRILSGRIMSYFFCLAHSPAPPHPPLNLLFSASFTIFKRLSTSPVSVRSCGAHFLSFFVFFYSLVFCIRGPLRWSIFFSWPHQTGLLPPGTLWYVGDGQEGDSIRG